LPVRPEQLFSGRAASPALSPAIYAKRMSDGENQKLKAETFRKLHRAARILVLPNTWDVASSRIVEDAGFEAIATSSAGIAFSLGYPDGQRISRSEMIAAVARIAHAVRIPVSADVEAGYGDRAEDAAQTAAAVIEADAVGMNLEDSRDDAAHPLIDLTLAVEKIKAVREAASAAGVPIVLNARTDVYLAQVGKPESRYDETVRRLSAYRDAGADCLFAPGVRDASTIGRLVRDLNAPLNILAGPGLPPVPELQKLGVARVSLGSGPMRATLGLLARMAEELKTSGTYEAMNGAPTHAEVNRMMEASSKS
jgi:2-methylisocitrate lyase-like PEP mutase family enzyme